MAEEYWKSNQRQMPNFLNQHNSSRNWRLQPSHQFNGMNNNSMDFPTSSNSYANHGLTQNESYHVSDQWYSNQRTNFLSKSALDTPGPHFSIGCNDYARVPRNVSQGSSSSIPSIPSLRKENVSATNRGSLKMSISYTDEELAKEQLLQNFKNSFEQTWKEYSPTEPMPILSKEIIVAELQDLAGPGKLVQKLAAVAAQKMALTM